MGNGATGVDAGLVCATQTGRDLWGGGR
jgi:hypothetical protein